MDAPHEQDCWPQAVKLRDLGTAATALPSTPVVNAPNSAMQADETPTKGGSSSFDPTADGVAQAVALAGISAHQEDVHISGNACLGPRSVALRHLSASVLPLTPMGRATAPSSFSAIAGGLTILPAPPTGAPPTPLIPPDPVRIPSDGTRASFHPTSFHHYSVHTSSIAHPPTSTHLSLTLGDGHPAAGRVAGGRLSPTGTASVVAPSEIVSEAPISALSGISSFSAISGISSRMMPVREPRQVSDTYGSGLQ